MKTFKEFFIESKQKNIIKSGFEIADSALNEKLFAFQKFIVKRALHAGKYAIFADCGWEQWLVDLTCPCRIDCMRLAFF